MDTGSDDDFVFTPLRKSRHKTNGHASLTQPTTSTRNTGHSVKGKQRISSTQLASSKKRFDKTVSDSSGLKSKKVSELLQQSTNGSKKLKTSKRDTDLETISLTSSSVDLSFAALERKSPTRNKCQKSIERCPICHVPLNLVGKKELPQHEIMCRKQKWESKPTCDQGSACTVTGLSHFSDLSHRQPSSNEKAERKSCFDTEGGFIRTPAETHSSPPTPSERSLSLLRDMNDEAIFQQLTQPHSTQNTSVDLDRTIPFATPDHSAHASAATVIFNIGSSCNGGQTSAARANSGEEADFSTPSVNLEDTPVLKKTYSWRSTDTELEVRTSRVSQWLKECPTVDEIEPSDAVSVVESDIELSRLKSVSVTGSPAKRARRSEPSPAKSERQTSITSYFGCKVATPVKVPTPTKSPEKEARSVEKDRGKAIWSEIMLKMRKSEEVRKEDKSACPDYKKIQGTKFVVDAFSYGYMKDVTHYFLTHYHYDHYMGLNQAWKMPIYCSHVTASLLATDIGVNRVYIHVLALNKPTTVQGVEVTALEANHCPGAVMLLFKLPDGKVILHTGDFRGCEDMEKYPALQGISVSQLHLDTTFCDSQYDFPPQIQVIETAVKLSEQYSSANKKVLIVVGSYKIGKERLYEAIASKLNLSIWADQKKRKLWKCLSNPSLLSHLSEDPRLAGLHVLPMGMVNIAGLNRYLTEFEDYFESILAFKPTGWEYNGDGLDIETLPTSGNRKVSVYAIPYSEHSSYSELKRFVRFLQPKFVIPTVNAETPAAKKKLTNIFALWKQEDNRTTSGKTARQTKLSMYLQ